MIQKKIFKEMSGAARFTYNTCIAGAMKIINSSWHSEFKERKRFEMANFQKLRNLLVTKKAPTKADVIIPVRPRNVGYKTLKKKRSIAIKRTIATINDLNINPIKLKYKPTINFRANNNKFQMIELPKKVVNIFDKFDELKNRKRFRTLKFQILHKLIDAPKSVKSKNPSR